MIANMRCIGAAAGLALLLCGPARAQEPQPLAGDYGSVGLWQTPSARFGEEGAVNMGIVANSPYNRLAVSVSPVEGVETTFRYTDITNRLYSPFPEFSGNQSYKDRGFDLKLRLLKESDSLPAVALGFRDLGGTQLFGAQFLVASRRYYNFDLSAGLGWGRLGSGGPIDNPFAREVTASTGPGEFSAKSLFTSQQIGLFGGLTWDAPIEGLQLAIEYDPNDYKSEPFDNTQDVRFPVNVGAKYRLPGGAVAGLSYQRGNILSFQLGMAFNIGAANGIPKVLDPRPPLPREITMQMAAKKTPPELPTTDATELAKRVEAALRAQRISMLGFRLADDQQSVRIWIAPSPYRDTQKLIGRASRAASSVLPPSVLVINVTEAVGAAESYDAAILRPALDKAAAGAISLDEFKRAVTISAADPDKPEPVYSNVRYPAAGWSLNPSLRSSVGGPDSFYFGQLWLKLGGFVSFTPSWSADGVLGFNLYNNFGDLQLESDSQLPKVRSDIKNYLKDGEQALVRLETNFIEQLSPHWYGRVSAGIFEEMFGGVAGELLYRPSNPRWALGVNVNRVRQRDFNQRLTFRDYEVTTGHVTAYFEFPRPSVLLKLSAGQYLAGDRGATLEISRQFANGVRIGAFATKTNVSAAQFGEGSFDKGIYFVMPLDALLPRSTTGAGSFLLRPLTRDGGQMVRDGRSLYDTTYGAVKARLPLRDDLFFE